MKIDRKPLTSPTRSVSLGSLGSVFVVASLVCAASAGAQSVQSGRSTGAKVEEVELMSTNSPAKTYVTTNASGLVIALDRDTGQARALTAEESAKLAAAIKDLVNQSADGLVQVRRADGSVSMNLQGRFQNVLLAKKTDSGTIDQACVDNVDAASAFLDLDVDPALVTTLKRAAVSRRSSQQLELR